MIKDSLFVFPDRKTYASSQNARCFMFYDFENPIGTEWLDVANEIFLEFGQVIAEETGNLEKQHTHGNFNRVQKRIRGFLESVQNGINVNFDIRIQSRSYIESEAFFPVDIQMVLSQDREGRKKGTINVREIIVKNYDSLINKVAAKIFRLAGPMYANVFDFPTVFGPDAYLASVGTILSGMSSIVNRTYESRITRWRDNRWEGKLSSQGYLREVYPVNFVLDVHLKMPFQNRPFEEYMKKVGELKVSEYSTRVFRWNVSEERIDDIRLELEKSGLILSSP
jgi:hypothetical protein